MLDKSSEPAPQSEGQVVGVRVTTSACRWKWCSPCGLLCALLSALRLLGGINTHCLHVRLLCGLICVRSYTLYLIEAQLVVNLTIVLASAVAESAAHLHALLQVLNHVGVERLQ